MKPVRIILFLIGLAFLIKQVTNPAVSLFFTLPLALLYTIFGAMWAEGPEEPKA